MLTTIKKSAAGVAALAAFGLGGAAIAGAAGSGSTSSGSGRTQSRPARPPQDTLSSADAAKVRAAALDKVPGATVLRTEAGGPYGTPYHAHVKTSDGKYEVVLVSSSFQATSVQADDNRGRRGHGGPGGGGPGAGETALTGDTKDSVEKAVLAKYPGATIVRTETNNGAADAPYESHITTSDGKQLEVHVSKDLQVLDAQQQPTHP